MLSPLSLRATSEVPKTGVTPPPAHRIMPKSAVGVDAEPTTVPKSLIPEADQVAVPKLGIVTIVGKNVNVQEACVCACDAEAIAKEGQRLGELRVLSAA